MPNGFLYEPRELVAAVDALDRPSLFLLDRFFPEVFTFESKRIDFDKLDKADGLAPFVSPHLKGVATRGRGYATDSFLPAYVKPKGEVDFDTPIRRRPGEMPSGEMTNAQRGEAIVLDLLDDQRKSILRRKEWMAASVLSTGKVVVSGEDYPSQEVDFGRDAGLSLALTGGAQWGEAGVDPIDTLEAMFASIATASGATVDTVVMDPKAWGLARKSETIIRALDSRRGGGGNSGNLGASGVGGVGTRARKVAELDGIEYFVYQEPYTLPDGTQGKMMADHSVIVGSAAQIEGYQAHGAIKDAEAGYMPAEVYPKNWIEKDPGIEFVMSQSAPLVVPGRANATGYVKVRV